MDREARVDQIGYWSEIKLEIIKEYATAYSTILSAQRNPPFTHVYIEGFAGAGVHQSTRKEGLLPGSPLNALQVKPPFRGYHLIDIQENRVRMLQKLIGDRADVFFYHGDCNEILLSSVFPKITWKNYGRGLCILDPYGLNLEWRVLEAAGKSQVLDIFVNFPVMGMNRNALRRDPQNVAASQKAKMTAAWGDDSWIDIAYDEDMFGNPDKRSSDVIVEAFRRRLKEIAGFERVPKPIPMRNSKGGIIYYLYFASQKNTAEKLVLSIFKKYENRGA